MGDQMEYVDFEINIIKSEGEELIVRINSLGGHAEARFTDPFSEDKRIIIRQTLTNAALRSSARVRSSSVAEVNTMKDVGATLFDQTVRDQVRELYYQCLATACNQGKGMRVRLNIDASLQDLPWEFLATPQKSFLALDPRTPVVRYIDLATPNTPLKTELPLRILVVIASPKDQALLDTAAEKNRIASALDPLQEQGLVKVNYIEGPDTWTRLIDAIRPNETHILHFIGHGSFDESHQEGVLVMENEDGSSMFIPSELTRILLQGKTRLRLVVLNACLGTQAGEAEPLSSVAVGMVYAGVPAVIAMQFEVSDGAAQIIAGTFYKSLALNFPVDAAMTEARRQIMLLDRDSLEWATPVLYMQVPDGQLFDIHIPEARKPKEGITQSGQITTGQMDNVVKMMYGRAEQSFAQHKYEDALKYYKMVRLQNANYQETNLRIAEIGRILGGGEASQGIGVQQPPPSGVASDRPEPPAAQAPTPGQPPQPGRAQVDQPGGVILDLNAKAAELYQAGEIAITRGDWEDAIKAFKGTMMLVPNYKDATQKLASCERRNQCVKMYEQAQQFYGNRQYTLVLNTLAQIRSIEPRWVDSADLQMLAECGQMYMQALGALRAGDTDSGAELLRNVLLKKPDFEDVASRLENLAEGGTGLFGEAPVAQTPPSYPQQPSPGRMPIPGQKAQPIPQPGQRPQYPGQPQQPQQPQNERIYELPGADASALAEEVRQYFMTSGYQNQVLQQGTAYTVQGKKEDVMRSLLGMSYAATVIIEPTENGLKASVGGGKWLDKAAVAAFGMIVALGFTVFTAGYGATQQKALENNLWALIERHVSTQGGRRVA
jgi:hypothetical protein